MMASAVRVLLRWDERVAAAAASRDGGAAAAAGMHADCCDGSDEKSSAVTCSNTCKEVAELAAMREAALLEEAAAGSEINAMWAAAGRAVRVAVEQV
jgi:hypothetical protein